MQGELVPLVSSDLHLPADDPTLMEAIRQPRLSLFWGAHTPTRALLAMLTTIAARGLGHMGPAAKEAVPALTAALKTRDVRVRTAAAKALGNIGPDAAASGHAHHHRRPRPLLARLRWR